MYLILSKTRAEAANYARQQGWKQSEWQTPDGSLRNVPYDAIVQLESWSARGNRHALESELRRYQHRFPKVERVLVSGNFRPRQAPEPRPTPRPERNPDIVEALRRRVDELEEENSELRQTVAEDRGFVSDPWWDDPIATEDADEAVAPFVAEVKADEERIDRGFLESLKKPELKKVAREHGIHVTSQTPATLVNRILEARELNSDG